MKQSLEEVIKLIEKNTDSSTAYIDITSTVDDYPVMIQGNPEGLRLLASELLRRSIEIEEGYLVMSNIPDAKWVLEDYLPLSITGMASTRKEILENKEYTKADNQENRSFKD